MLELNQRYLKFHIAYFVFWFNLRKYIPTSIKTPRHASKKVPN